MSKPDQIVTVAAGDSLAKIAQRHHKTTKELADYNRLTSPNAIYVGQTLHIPQGAESVSVAFRLRDFLGEAITGLECKVVQCGKDMGVQKTNAEGFLPKLQVNDAQETIELWVKKIGTDIFKKVGEIIGGDKSRVVYVTSGKHKIETTTRPAAEKAVFRPEKGTIGKKSGIAWASEFPDVKDEKYLDPGFAKDFNEFRSALEAGRVRVHVSSVYRPPQRSYLMYWAQQIADGKVSPDKALPFLPRGKDAPVDIDWQHMGPDGKPDLVAAKRAATELVRQGFKIKAGTPVAKEYNSNHTKGLAVDMSFTPNWGIGMTVKDTNGMNNSIGSKNDLFLVGKSYGILHWDLRAKKNNKKDDVHWSRTGG